MAFAPSGKWNEDSHVVAPIRDGALEGGLGETQRVVTSLRDRASVTSRANKVTGLGFQ